MGGARALQLCVWGRLEDGRIGVKLEHGLLEGRQYVLGSDESGVAGVAEREGSLPGRTP